MGYQELKEEDVFAAIFLKNFYQADRREDNLDKDLAQNCKLTLAFHNFLKRKVTPEDFMKTLIEANPNLHKFVAKELEHCAADDMFLNDMFMMDFDEKCDEWIYSVGLDNDHLDAPFSEKLQRAFVHFENLDFSERIKLGKSTRKWIEKHFPSLAPTQPEEESTLNEESTAEDDIDPGEILGKFQLPMPVTNEKKVRTVKFAKTMAEEDVDGFKEMVKLLEIYQRVAEPLNVNLIANILVADKSTVWDTFNNHFHEISLLASIHEDGRGAKPLRVLALRLGIVLNYFGYDNAAKKCLMAAQLHSYTSNDKVIMKQVMLWRAFITNEILPTTIFGQSDRWGTLTQLNASLCDQLTSLSELQRMLRLGEPKESIYKRLYDWIPNNNQKAAHFLAIAHFISIKSVIYEYFGFRRLSTLCSETIMNIGAAKGEETSLLLNFSLLQMNAAKLLRVNLPKASDLIREDKDILQDLRRLARGNFNGIVVGKSDGSSWRLEELEVIIDEKSEARAQVTFVDILDSMDVNEKSAFIHIRLQILHSKIRMLEEELDESESSQINVSLKEAMDRARARNYKGLEMEANFMLAKLAIRIGNYDHAINYLKDSEEYYSMNADLYNERSHFLQLLTANLLRTVKNKALYSEESITWIIKELGELADEFEGTSSLRDLIKYEEIRSLSYLANFLMKACNSMKAKKTPSQSLLTAVQSLMMSN